jgi:hypothetical protein
MRSWEKGNRAYVSIVGAAIVLAWLASAPNMTAAPVPGGDEDTTRYYYVPDGIGAHAFHYPLNIFLGTS